MLVGVVVGLVVGKLVGVTVFSWLAVRLGVGPLPAGVGWAHVSASAAVAGIGFTVSLFITGFAFGTRRSQPMPRRGPGCAVVAAALGAVLLARRRGAQRLERRRPGKRE